jgi:hypothetical protein
MSLTFRACGVVLQTASSFEPQVHPVGTIFERAGNLESAILSCVPPNEIVGEDELRALDMLALMNPLLAEMVESCLFCNLEMAWKIR